MKVKWLIGERIVPGVGTIKPGQILDLPTALAKALIVQRQAEAVIVKKSKKFKSKTKRREGD